MARLITKKSTVLGKVPLAADLDIGELAVNTADAKLYTKHSDGSVKEIAAASGGSSAPAPVIARLVATQASTVVALANITALVAPMVANGVYMCEAFVTFRSAATTTGINLGFTSPAGCEPMLEVVVPVATTANATALRKIFPNAADTVSGSVLGTGVTAVNANQTARISGIIINGATAGNFQLTFASEIAGSAITLQIDSTLVLTKVA